MHRSQPKDDTGGEPPCCPQCGSTRLASMFYGLPAMTKDLMSRVHRGDVILAGCVVFEDSPNWRCRDCGTSFREAASPSRQT